MHTRRQTTVLRGGEHPPGLVDGERPLVDEDVAGSRERSTCGQHLLDDEVDVLGPRHFPIGDVGAEERRVDVERGPLPHGDRREEHPDFVRGAQAVPGLDLDGGGARSEHAQGPGRRRLDEFVGRCRPGRRDGRVDPATCGEDGGIRVAGEPTGELVGTVTPEDQVGVGVDEPGEHGSAVDIERREVAELTGNVSLTARPGDGSGPHRDRRPVDQAEIPRDPGGVRDELADAGEQQIAHVSSIGRWTPRSRATSIASSYPASA